MHPSFEYLNKHEFKALFLVVWKPCVIWIVSVNSYLFPSYKRVYFHCQGTVMVAGRARAVVVGVGPNTAMGSIRDSMLRTEDVSIEF